MPYGQPEPYHQVVKRLMARVAMLPPGGHHARVLPGHGTLRARGAPGHRSPDGDRLDHFSALARPQPAVRRRGVGFRQPHRVDGRRAQPDPARVHPGGRGPCYPGGVGARRWSGTGGRRGTHAHRARTARRGGPSREPDGGAGGSGDVAAPGPAHGGRTVRGNHRVHGPSGAHRIAPASRCPARSLRAPGNVSVEVPRGTRCGARPGTGGRPAGRAHRAGDADAARPGHRPDRLPHRPGGLDQHHQARPGVAGGCRPLLRAGLCHRERHGLPRRGERSWAGHERSWAGRERRGGGRPGSTAVGRVRPRGNRGTGGLVWWQPDGRADSQRRFRHHRPAAGPVSEAGAGSPIRVLVADDQELVRAGFCVILDATDGIAVVGEAANGFEAVAAAAARKPDVVLMDIRMPGMDGLEATRLITGNRQEAGPKVVMLTTFDLDDYVYEALRAGASGFLLKDAPRADLIAAVRAAAAGNGLLAPSVTRLLIEAFARRPAAAVPAPSRLASLTARENDILLLLARGRSNAEIARELFVGEATVKTHVGHLLAKLGLRDRVQAVILAYETGTVLPGIAETPSQSTARLDNERR